MVLKKFVLPLCIFARVFSGEVALCFALFAFGPDNKAKGSTLFALYSIIFSLSDLYTATPFSKILSMKM